MYASVDEVYELKVDVKTFETLPVIFGNINIETFSMDGNVEPTIDREIYDESYQIISSLNDDIILPTKGKIMSDNIVVNKVPVTEVSNESGGYTLTVG